MPQMMPINWLIIFLMCMICLISIMILMNSLLLNLKIKNFKKKIIYKKWKWLW
uniref:ATP synthase F0 subunit 8 n=1 Tax=Bombus longipennis TaxID=1164558 RepID=A0A8F2TCE9_9HYME|nr:ATP synthase F0 subunit 8 [Bombus longipennis]QWV61245.1 ATP synthase F0 subunit 8 [Bombus longipennis]DBA43627.1 TPA_asm: ATP8 [Bombus lucorum]